MLKANNNNIFFSITVIWQVLPLLFSCWFTQQNREQNTFICFFWIFFSSLNIFALNTYEVLFLFPVLLFYKAHCSCWTEWYGQRCEMCKSNKKLSFQLNETSDRLHDGGRFHGDGKRIASVRTHVLISWLNWSPLWGRPIESSTVHSLNWWWKRHLSECRQISVSDFVHADRRRPPLAASLMKIQWQRIIRTADEQPDTA